jgi:hypothetical protein
VVFFPLCDACAGAQFYPNMNKAFVPAFIRNGKGKRTQFDAWEVARLPHSSHAHPHSFIHLLVSQFLTH